MTCLEPPFSIPGPTAHPSGPGGPASCGWVGARDLVKREIPVEKEMLPQSSGQSGEGAQCQGRNDAGEPTRNAMGGGVPPEPPLLGRKHCLRSIPAAAGWGPWQQQLEDTGSRRALLGTAVPIGVDMVL